VIGPLPTLDPLPEPPAIDPGEATEFQTFVEPDMQQVDAIGNDFSALEPMLAAVLDSGESAIAGAALDLGAGALEFESLAADAAGQDFTGKILAAQSVESEAASASGDADALASLTAAAGPGPSLPPAGTTPPGPPIGTQLPQSEPIDLVKGYAGAYAYCAAKHPLVAEVGGFFCQDQTRPPNLGYDSKTGRVVINPLYKG